MDQDETDRQLGGKSAMQTQSFSGQNVYGTRASTRAAAAAVTTETSAATSTVSASSPASRTPQPPTSSEQLRSRAVPKPSRNEAAWKSFRARAANALSSTFAEDEFVDLATLLHAVNAAGPPISEEDARVALEAMSEENQVMLAEGACSCAGRC